MNTEMSYIAVEMIQNQAEEYSWSFGHSDARHGAMNGKNSGTTDRYRSSSAF